MVVGLVEGATREKTNVGEAVGATGATVGFRVGCVVGL